MIFLRREKKIHFKYFLQNKRSTFSLIILPRMCNRKIPNTYLEKALFHSRDRTNNLSDKGDLSKISINVGYMEVPVAPSWSMNGSPPDCQQERDSVVWIHTKEKSLKKVVEILENKYNEKEVLSKLFYKNEEERETPFHINIGCKGLMMYDGETPVEATFMIYTCFLNAWFAHVNEWKYRN